MATSECKVIFRTLVQLSALAVALTLAACATTQPKSTDASAQAEPEVSAAPETEIVDDFEGNGMEIPLDGSSLAAFEASMARVKRHSDPNEYITLENSIEYLLVYDLEVKRSKEKLAAKLDGLNGYEVMSRVGWRKPPPGRSNAEKDAADAKIIDT